MKSLPNGSNGLMFLSGCRFGMVVIEGLLALLKLFHQYPTALSHLLSSHGQRCISGGLMSQSLPIFEANGCSNPELPDSAGMAEAFGNQTLDIMTVCGQGSGCVAD
jgi:hypothetical protein